MSTNATAQANDLRRQINALGAELELLQRFYEDSDRQDPQLRAAIRKQKKQIRETRERLAALT